MSVLGEAFSLAIISDDRFAPSNLLSRQRRFVHTSHGRFSRRCTSHRSRNRYEGRVLRFVVGEAGGR
jgi:hypothetical protein